MKKILKQVQDDLDSKNTYNVYNDNLMTTELTTETLPN